MLVRDIVGIAIAIVVLAGVTVAIKNGGNTANVVDAFGRNFSGTITAATKG